jgi:hypothetical protein
MPTSCSADLNLGFEGDPHRNGVPRAAWWALLRRADGTSSTTATSAAARCTHASESRFDWFLQMIMPTHRPIRLLFRPHRSWMFNGGTANGGASPNGCSFSKTGHWNLAIRPERLLNYLHDAPPACWNLPTRIAAERGSAVRRTAPRIHPIGLFPVFLILSVFLSYSSAFVVGGPTKRYTCVGIRNACCPCACKHFDSNAAVSPAPPERHRPAGRPGLGGRGPLQRPFQGSFGPCGSAVGRRVV